MSREGSDQSGVSTTATDRRTVLKTTATAAAVAAGGAGVSGSAGARSAASISFERTTINSYDGTELGATLYVPAKNGPRPSVLMTHGWGAFRQSPITVSKAKEYAKNGYTVLTYDSRGFSSSEGTVGLNGPRETRDAQRMIDFLANETGQFGVDVALDGPDNPRVGMDGISYAGGIQFQVAEADHRLDAMVPRITWNDLEYSLAPGGVVKSGWLTALLGLGEINTLFDDDADVTDNLSRWYRQSIKNNEVPDDAVEAFQSRSVAFKDGIDTPTFLMQGWTDSLFNPTEALDTYRQLQDGGTKSRLLFYEGGHDLSELTVDFSDRGRMNDHAVRWMNQHVRGQQTEVAQVSNYLPQRNQWREDGQFPPADATTNTYELANGGQGSGAEIEQGWSWFTDEAVTYQWTAADDIELIGEPTIELTVDVAGPEARLFFELFHDGDNINGMDQPRLVDSSGTQDISVQYPAIQEFVNEGDSIGLEISVTNPLYVDSRESDGVTIDATNSRLYIPQRPDENAPEDEEDDDCWLFC